MKIDGQYKIKLAKIAIILAIVHAIIASIYNSPNPYSPEATQEREFAKRIERRLDILEEDALEVEGGFVVVSDDLYVRLKELYFSRPHSLEEKRQAMQLSQTKLAEKHNDSPVAPLSDIERKHADWRTIRWIIDSEHTSDGHKFGSGVAEASRRAENRGLLKFYKNARSAASAYSNAMGNMSATVFNRITLPDSCEEA